MKKFANGMAEMLLFKSVTNMPRFMEISFGIFGWLQIALIFYSLTKIIFS
jgi:hypothetical protein